MTYPVKGRADYLELGQWNARCSMCNFKRKSGTLVKNWQGMWRCPEHNEPRQPQDFVRGVPDKQTPPWVQPLNQDSFVATVFICTEDSDNSDSSSNMNLNAIYNLVTETVYPLQTET